MCNRTLTIISIVLWFLIVALSIILLVTGSEGAFGIERTVLSDIHIAICFLNAAVIFCCLIIRNK